MNIRQLREVLTIVASYVDEDRSWNAVGHGLIIFPLMEDVSQEDIEKLSALGAYYDVEVEGHWYVFV